MESEYANFHRKEWPGTDVIEVGSVLPDPRRSAHPTSLKRKVQKKLRESPGPAEDDVFLAHDPKRSKDYKFRKALKSKSKEKKWFQPAPQVVTLGDSPMDASKEGARRLGRWVPPESAQRIKYGDRKIEAISEEEALKLRRERAQQSLGSAQLKKTKRKRKRTRKTKKYSKRSRTKKSRNKKYKPKNKSRRKSK